MSKKFDNIYILCEATTMLNLVQNFLLTYFLQNVSSDTIFLVSGRVRSYHILYRDIIIKRKIDLSKVCESKANKESLS